MSDFTFEEVVNSLKQNHLILQKAPKEKLEEEVRKLIKSDHYCPIRCRIDSTG